MGRLVADGSYELVLWRLVTCGEKKVIVEMANDVDETNTDKESKNKEIAKG